MAITIYYADLRVYPSKLERYQIEWQPELTAFGSIVQAVGEASAQAIDDGLRLDDLELIVSWSNKVTGDVSEIGGVGRLDWHIDDNSILTVTYDNGTTTQAQEVEFEKWMLENEPNEKN